MYKGIPFLSGKGPIAFCDIVGTEEEGTDESLKGSKMNMDEARKAVSCRLNVRCVVHPLLCQVNPTCVLFPRWSWSKLLAH